MKSIQTVKFRYIVATILLSLFGYAGNYMSVPIVYSVTFIFGSIFSIIALRSLGFWWGFITAFLASVYTYYLWNHPYAIIIFTAEVIWIGIALQKGKSNIVIIDSLFWLILGAPLVAFFYYGVMRLGLQITAIIILKQAINGILNALIASIILTYTPLIVWITGEKTKNKYDFSLSIFHLISTFLIVPTLGLILFQNYQGLSSTQDQVVKEVIADAEETENIVSDWIFRHVTAIRLIGEIGSKYPKKPSPKIQQELHDILTLFPDFYNVYLGDANAMTYAFYPATNQKGQPTIGINFADREYFKQLKKTLQPFISDMIMGRGGIFQPIFTISVPVAIEGKLSHFALGAMDFEKIKKIFQKIGDRENIIHTIIDRKNNVVYSSDPSRNPLSKISETDSSQIITLYSKVFLRTPGNKKNISIMNTWKNAVYFTKRPIHGTPWTLMVEYPVGPLQKNFYDMAILSLGTVTLIYLVLIGLAFFLSNLITYQLKSLSLISKGIPQKIDRGEKIIWPQSNVTEVSDLIDHYAETAHTLENQLLESRERYKALVDISPSGIWTADNSGKYNYVSSKWSEITGIPSVDSLEYGWLKGVHPDDLDRITKDWSDAVLNGSFFQADYRLALADENSKWVLSIASTIKENNKINGWIGTITDITERRQAEDALRESEERLSLTLKGTKAGLWDWYIESQKTIFNDRWAEIIGYTLAELNSKSIDSWLEFIHPDDQEKVNTMLSKHYAGELDYFECESRLKHKNGEWIWVLARGMVTEWSKDGKPVRITGTHIDITDRIKKEILKISLEEKETLLQEIHHRVKNNMQVISSLLKLQARNIEDSKVKEALNESQNRVYAMSALHEALYRSENLAEIDFKTYLSTISNSLIQTYQIHPEKVRFKIESDNIVLDMKKASPLGLTINELISNSLKHAFPGNRNGEVKIQLKKLPDSKVELSVIDNGVGIPENYNWKESGTLGLRLICDLVEKQLDGTIKMEQENGTRFTINFNINRD